MCVFVARGGLMTLHRPLILSERVIMAIKAGWATEAVCVLGIHASTSLIIRITDCSPASVLTLYSTDENQRKPLHTCTLATPQRSTTVRIKGLSHRQIYISH